MSTLKTGGVALVTGAGSGMGRMASVAFGRRGVSVVVADIDEVNGGRTVAAVEEAGGKAAFQRCDVRKLDEVGSAVDKAMSSFGRLDYAFNNAGIDSALAPTDEMREEEWHRVISVNLTGVWNCLKHEMRVMRAQRSGAIVNNSSIYGLVGFPNASPYIASKHGVVGLTRAAALEGASLGIRVNAICPGMVDTPLTRTADVSPDILKAIAAAHPIGRVAQPEEVVDAVLWLCMSATFVTGQALAVDGGYTTQ